MLKSKKDNLEEEKMQTICSFQEYNNWRRGKKSWTEKEVHFDFELGKSTCGLCSREFESTEYRFLLCPLCVSKKVDWNGHLKIRTAYVYGLYSMDDKLVYIGVTKNPEDRVHNHMLTKNFKHMKIIESFSSRERADDFEKYSIYMLRPVINKLIDKDWEKIPTNWDASRFGLVAPKMKNKKIPTTGKKIKKICVVCNKNIGKNKQISLGDGKYSHKSCKKQEHILTVKCDRCGQAIGKNNLLVENGKKLHKKPCLTKEEQHSQNKKNAKEIRERNEQIKKLNKEISSVKRDSGPSCRYCKKPVSIGQHYRCRRRRLKETGRI